MGIRGSGDRCRGCTTDSTLSGGNGGLDLVLVDEIADEILVLENVQVQTSVEQTSVSRLKNLYR